MTKYNKFAFVLLHFGDKIKYFEYELYFIKMLRKFSGSNIDLIYMAMQDDTTNSTPQFFIETMKKYFDRVITVPGIPIDSGYKSHYSHFNTLLTCNFINAYKLINYDKVCIIESDMIITENISDIFNLPVPSTYFLNNNSHDPTIDSPINGGILLFKPSWYAWYKSLSLLPDLIAINAKYPNEELFVRTWKHINQLPQRYNYSHYLLRKIKQTDKLPTIVHLHETKWKALDIIRNNYINKFSAKIRVVKYFSKNFYEKYNKEIEAIIIEAQKLAIMHN